MRRLLHTFLFSLFLVLNLFAEEDGVYSYKFNIDTIIVGEAIGDGRIFPNYEKTFLSINHFRKDKKAISNAIFYDEKFRIIHKIYLKNNLVKFAGIPKIFDFDNDGFEEVIFAIKENDTLSLKYFNPSGNSKSLIKLFEIPIIQKPRLGSLNIKLISVQLDSDKQFELLVTLFQHRGISGMWAFDFETMKILWKKPTAEYLTSSEPIYFFDQNKSPYLIYSTLAYSIRKYFSNGKYFLKNITDNTFLTYDQDYNPILNAFPDTSALDYTCASISYIRRIDLKGNLIWERKIGNNYTISEITKIVKNGDEKILLAIYNQSTKTNIINAFEIIDPLTGNIESRIELRNRLKYYLIDKDKIYASKFLGQFSVYDFNFNLINEMKFPYIYNPQAIINYDVNRNFLLCSKGKAEYQQYVLFDETLEIEGKTDIRGSVVNFKKAGLFSIYSSITETSQITSILRLPWYDRISPTLLRNLTISFLSIVVVTMILWIITLRVSSKKIKLQKVEIEETHLELKETTSKLIRSEKLAVYGTIASGIAHEINSPLGAIINSAQRIKNNPSSDLEKNINLIEKAGKRSKAIIEKLLVNTRKKSDDKINLVEALNDWKELSQRQFDNLGISFNSDIKCNCLLAISSTELNQIFTNLFFNARDAITENNSVTKEISISSQIKDNFCSVLIQDTGPGFSSEKLKSPFEAFETTKEKGKGTGLGLWVVKSILDSVNGSIQIRNYEKGAEIEILIPHFEKTKHKL